MANGTTQKTKFLQGKVTTEVQNPCIIAGYLPETQLLDFRGTRRCFGDNVVIGRPWDQTRTFNINLLKLLGAEESAM